jgi:hypothetical protein
MFKIILVSFLILIPFLSFAQKGCPEIYQTEKKTPDSVRFRTYALIALLHEDKYEDNHFEDAKKCTTVEALKDFFKKDYFPKKEGYDCTKLNDIKNIDDGDSKEFIKEIKEALESKVPERNEESSPYRKYIKNKLDSLLVAATTEPLKSVPKKVHIENNTPSSQNTNAQEDETTNLDKILKSKELVWALLLWAILATLYALYFAFKKPRKNKKEEESPFNPTNKRSESNPLDTEKIKVLEMKIKELEEENKALNGEINKKNTPEMRNSEKNSTDSEKNKEKEPKTSAAPTVVKYLSYPNLPNGFSERVVFDTDDYKEHFYTIQINSDGKTAKFFFNKELIIRGREDFERVLIPVCDVKNLENGYQVKSQTPGDLKLENGNWVVINKLKIELI